MMNKLRDNTGVVLWILVISFGVIWVLQDSGALDTAGTATGTNIIVVDGDPIAFEEYQRVLNAQMEQYQAQTGEPMTPQQTDALREQIFQYLVEDRLREQEMERLGITVTDEELVDMIYGEDPHPIIRAYFGNQQGEVDPLLLQNVAQNPEYREQLLELENYLRAERRREKLDNLIQATVRVSDADVLEAYDRQNRSVDTRFVALRYADVPAEEVELTESDLRSFYNEHRDEFERERTYTLAYVTISKDPTPEDTALVQADLERIRPRFQAAEDDSLFLAQNASERPFTSAYFRADELDENVAEVVFSNLEEGAVVGPVISNDLAHLVKIVDVRPSDEVAVRARHILLRAPEEDEEQRAAMRTLALELEERLREGEPFAELAEEYSGDPGSAVRGGDLGWFGPGRMVQPFEEAALDAPVGQVVGPVETQFGYHLIEVTGRADEEVQLADYALRVRPDISTLNRIQERLDDLQYYAEESGDFAAEAERLDLDVQQVQVEADQEFIPGLGTSRAIQNFLSGADTGDISDVIELDDQFVVLQVEEIQPEGYRPFEEVRAEIEPRARLAEQREIQTARLRSALADAESLQALAQAVGAQVRTAENVQFNNPVVPTLGREPKFTGTALGLEEGETSGVVAGENAAFVIETTSVQEPPPITQSQRDQIRAQLLNQRRNMVMQQWLTSLRDQAEVEDYRRRFQQ